MGTQWLAAVLTLTATLSACTGAPPGATPASPAASSAPAATPTYRLRPVVGERVPAVYQVSAATVLGLGTPAPSQDVAVDTFFRAIGDYLDAHLDRLQRTGTGLLGDVTADGFRDTGAVEALTSDLASPDAPVAAARYLIDIYHDGAPQWASARVEVTHPDGSTATATFVFTVGPDGGLVLTLAGDEPAGGVS